jgi:hypothetical protein
MVVGWSAVLNLPENGTSMKPFLMEVAISRLSPLAGF